MGSYDELTSTRRPTSAEPARFKLSSDETGVVCELLTRLMDVHSSADSPAFLRDALLHGHRVPLRLRRFLADMRGTETAAAWVVSGFPVDDETIGPTPEGWAKQPDRTSTTREEMWLVQCARLLGEVFGWATQQNGALIHDISPVRGYEYSQLGSGSSGLLWWHTEEAFHPFKCDYLGLLCLRNRDRVPTTLASLGDIELDGDVRRVLFEPRYTIRPDDSHLEDHRVASASAGKESQLLIRARARIEQMNRQPPRVPVLSGDPDAPYLSIDPFYMDVPDDDPEARQALDAVSAAIDARLREVVLAPGDVLFIDNFRAVHGRQPFQARFDGTDRWLKRVNITRDLRKSRAVRMGSESLVIY